MVNCAVKAFVEATPISGPVCVKIPASVSLDIVLPTTLQIPSVIAPSSFAFLIAANVSAVSPDWLIAIIIVLLSIIAFL